MFSSSFPNAPTSDGPAADASSSSDSSVSPQLSPRKKGRFQPARDAARTGTTSIAQSCNLHDLLCNLCDSDGSRYPDYIILESTAAFEHRMHADPLAPLRGVTFNAKRSSGQACRPGNGAEACNWRLCFGAIPSISCEAEVVECRNTSGEVAVKLVQSLREENKNCFQQRHNWYLKSDDSDGRLTRAEMLYVTAAELLSRNHFAMGQSHVHVTRNMDIVAEVCSRASFEELLALRGAQDIDTMLCLSALAASFARQNKLAEARQCYMKCIAGTSAAAAAPIFGVPAHIAFGNFHPTSPPAFGATFAPPSPAFGVPGVPNAFATQTSAFGPAVIACRRGHACIERTDTTRSCSCNVCPGRGIAKLSTGNFICKRCEYDVCAGCVAVIKKSLSSSPLSESIFCLQLDLAGILLKQGSSEEPVAICIRVLTEANRYSKSSFRAAAHLCRLAQQVAENKRAFHGVETRFEENASALTTVFEHILSLDASSEEELKHFMCPFILLLNCDYDVNSTSELSNVPGLQFLLSFIEFARTQLNANAYDAVLVRFKRFGLQHCIDYIAFGDWQRAGLFVPPLNLVDFWNYTVRNAREFSAPFALPRDVDSLPPKERMHAILYSASLPSNIDLGNTPHGGPFCEPELMQLLRKMRKDPDHITQLNLSKGISRWEIHSTAFLELTECFGKLTALQTLDLSDATYAHNLHPHFRMCCKKGHTMKPVENDEITNLRPIIDQKCNTCIYGNPKIALSHGGWEDGNKNPHWKRAWICNICNIKACFSCVQTTESAHSSPLDTEIELALVRSFMALTGLRTLNLSRTDVIKKSDFIPQLASSIAKLIALEHLHLCGALLIPDTSAKLGQSLVSVTGLKTLNLSGVDFISRDKAGFCHSMLSSIVQLRELQSFLVDVDVGDLIRHGFWMQSGLVVPPFDVLNTQQVSPFTDIMEKLPSPRPICWVKALGYAREFSAPFALPRDVDSLPPKERMHAILYSDSLPPNIDDTTYGELMCESEGVQLLQKLRQHSGIVTHLSLVFSGSVPKSSVGLMMQKEAWKSIADSACLQELTLCSQYDKSFVSATLPYLTRLRALDLSHVFEADVYQVLSALPQLRRLDLGLERNSAQKIDDTWGRGETTLTLNLYNGFIVPPSFLSSLKTLNLNCCENCGPMLCGMVALRTLRILRIKQYIPPVDLALCQSLAALTGLQSLDMYATFDSQSAAAFTLSCASMTGLESLTFSMLHFEGHAAFIEFCQSLAQIHMLRALDLKLPRISQNLSCRGNVSDLDGFFELLKSMTNLDTLIIDNKNSFISGVETFNQSLLLLTRLKILRLPHVGVGDSIISTLAALTQLHTLDLDSNGITRHALPGMCQTLLLLTQLQHLKLSWNFGGGDQITSEEYAAFCKSLKSMTDLRTLDLLRCFDEIDNCFYAAIASSLFHLTSLESAKLNESVRACVRIGHWQRAGLVVPPWDIIQLDNDPAYKYQNEWAKALQYGWRFSSPFPLPSDLKARSNEERHAILYSASIVTDISLKYPWHNEELLQLVRKLRLHPNHVTHLSLELELFDQIDTMLQLAAVISDLTALRSLSVTRYASRWEETVVQFPLTSKSAKLEAVRLAGFNLRATGDFDIGRTLTAASRLRTLKIKDCFFCEQSFASLCTSLPNLTLLEQLSISGFNLRATGGFDIGRTLTAASRLRTLKIQDCFFCEQSFASLCTSLPNLTLLEQFKLSKLQDFERNHLVVSLLAPALTTLTGLKMLNLWGVLLDRHSCCVIARVFTRLPQLQNVLLCRDIKQCQHECDLVGLDLPPSTLPGHFDSFFSTSALPPSTLPRHFNLSTTANWIHELRYARAFQMCCRFVSSSIHHLARTSSIRMPVYFSCFPGNSVTLDLALSASIHHPQTQSQLLLLMCFGGHTSHFFRVMMPSDARQRKDPRTVVMERLFSEQMVQHLFRLSKYQSTSVYTRAVDKYNTILSQKYKPISDISSSW
jgi:hypothetical protein